MPRPPKLEALLELVLSGTSSIPVPVNNQLQITPVRWGTEGSLGWCFRSPDGFLPAPRPAPRVRCPAAAPEPRGFRRAYWRGSPRTGHHRLPSCPPLAPEPPAADPLSVRTRVQCATRAELEDDAGVVAKQLPRDAVGVFGSAEQGAFFEVREAEVRAPVHSRKRSGPIASSSGTDEGSTEILISASRASRTAFRAVSLRLRSEKV